MTAAMVDASCSVGLRKLELDLLYYEPGSTCLALRTDTPPKVDGVLTDPAWNGVAPIVLRAETMEGGARVLVSDTGTGISGDDLPFIFDRFWKGDPYARRIVVWI